MRGFYEVQIGHGIYSIYFAMYFVEYDKNKGQLIRILKSV